MMKAPHSTWFSIYGQIDEVIARAMVDEGKIRPVPMSPGMPHEFNAEGQRARMVVIVPRQFMAEFNERIANLYA